MYLPLPTCNRPSPAGNAISFHNLVTFRELEADFSVALEVYGLQTPRELLPHNAKYHIRHKARSWRRRLAALVSPRRWAGRPGRQAVAVWACFCLTCTVTQPYKQDSRPAAQVGRGV